MSIDTYASFHQSHSSGRHGDWDVRLSSKAATELLHGTRGALSALLQRQVAG